MINVEYKAKVLPDGHLSCPEDIKKKLSLSNGAEVKVIISVGGRTSVPHYKSPSETEEVTGLCGAWQDDRDAEEIIQEIYSSRKGFKEVIL